MKIIREYYSTKKRTTAIAIYQSLTELSSNQGKDSFSAYNSQIAEYSGKSVSTVKNYCNKFIWLGILKKKLRKHGKINLSSEWTLLTPLVNNNYPTPTNDNNYTLVENNELLIEENIQEENNKKKEGLRKLKEIADRIRRPS
jgi:hypothetical protein